MQGLARGSKASVSWLSTASRCMSTVGYGETKPIVPLPSNEYERKAIIYKPSGPTAQYGYDQKAMNGGIQAKWKIRLPAQELWVNPLMGWASSADTAESAFHKMTFTTPEEAAKFLERQGLGYEVEEKSPNYDRAYRPPRYFQYGDNFSTKRKGMPDLSTMPSNRSKK